MAAGAAASARVVAAPLTKSSSNSRLISPPDRLIDATARNGMCLPAAALEKLTSELPTSSLSQPEIGFERRSTIRYLYVPEIAQRNSNHVPDGTRSVDVLTAIGGSRP
jgi:hypothetical protein